ncbi:MAG: polysaccharide deacetylase family protein [Acidobacteriia bacterium]|nr:polysaccharide deacetylase family protein [Terriglobia bacterium]
MVNALLRTVSDLQTGPDFGGGCPPGKIGSTVPLSRQEDPIGNHSFDHKKFSTVSEGEAHGQITRTDEIIDELHRLAKGARPAQWFRFPYGCAGAKGKQDVLFALGYWNPFTRTLPCSTSR